MIMIKVINGMFHVFNEHGTEIAVFKSLLMVLDYWEVTTWMNQKSGLNVSSLSGLAL